MKSSQGKEISPSITQGDIEAKGNTYGFCLIVTKYLHGTESIFVMDSRIHTVKEIEDLISAGVSSSDFIKK